MNKTNPSPEDKLRGNAYARAYNKIRSYALSLTWDIRLKHLDGIVDLEKTDNQVILKYTSPTTGQVQLNLNPKTSEIELNTNRGESYIFPIYSGDPYKDFVKGGVEQAIYAFQQRTEIKASRQPSMKICA